MDGCTDTEPEIELDLSPHHPGIMLREDYLPDYAAQGITRYRLAKLLRMTKSHFDELLAGKRGVTANTALRLGKVFRQSPEMWLNLQNDYDMRVAKRKYKDELDQIEPLIIEGFNDNVTLDKVLNQNVTEPDRSQRKKI